MNNAFETKIREAIKKFYKKNPQYSYSREKQRKRFCKRKDTGIIVNIKNINFYKGNSKIL